MRIELYGTVVKENITPTEFKAWHLANCRAHYNMCRFIVHSRTHIGVDYDNMYEVYGTAEEIKEIFPDIENLLDKANKLLYNI